ncbi:GspH/FimT family pseudopilin [Variovorax paradoxus]|uniref:GspH/FimT family pseudopilin n=1 Tax=Variovorax paradoxus TaxID=34073 RepID=UPI002160672F|nr:GspH/FimT family pseudopilin [Variovorax paradoxus]UVH60089.1 GspH/FimT family pseudopilin [Variovorax paradoxus]
MNNEFCASARAHSRHHTERPRGFTLVEMMVVIVLMTVLLAMALPSFSGLIEKYRVEGMASALMASVSHARSEAARRGKTVTIQARTGCTGRDWSCGWDTLVGSGATIETLRRQDPDTRVAVQKNVPGAMSFDAMGHSSFASFSFYPAGNADSSNAATVCISLGGRLRRVKGRDAC